jgi:hypothetical protein
VRKELGSFVDVPALKLDIRREKSHESLKTYPTEGGKVVTVVLPVVSPIAGIYQAIKPSHFLVACICCRGAGGRYCIGRVSVAGMDIYCGLSLLYLFIY